MEELSYQDVSLRKFRTSDARKMKELANNIKVSENLRDVFPHPYRLEDAKKYISFCQKQSPPASFAIEFRDQYVGNIALGRETDVYRNSAEIGYFIGEPYWNKGITTIAVRLMTEYGFKQLGLVRIHTGIFEYNKASMRVLEKCGFVKEGVFRKSVTKNGKLWDEHRYALLHPDHS